MFLTVLLTILKIIGLVLLFLFSAALILTAFALVSKIRYSASCGNDNGTYFCGNIKYLFGIVNVSSEYRDDVSALRVRLFGKTIYPKKAKRTGKEKTGKEKTEPVDMKKQNISEKIPDVSYVNKTANSDSNKHIYNEIKIQQSKPDISWEEKFPHEKVEKMTGKSSDDDDFSVKRVKISEIIDCENKCESDILTDESPETEYEENEESIQDNEKQDNSGITLKNFMEMSTEDKKLIVAAIFRFLKRVIKAVAPKKANINAVAGVGDPSYTGLLIAFCSAVKGLFIETLNVSGDFDKAVFKGNAEFSGKFTLGYLLFSALCFLKTRPVIKTVILFIKN